MSYDSKNDTREHIRQVADRLYAVRLELFERAKAHDASKLEHPEKPIFDEMTPKLKGLTYGSDEYKAALKDLSVALTHHYANNSHHPEHYPNGVTGFDLFDLIEMYCDWQAAVMRHADGDIQKSLDHNRERFKLSDQLASILQNTFDRYGDLGGKP